jgi:hypothetical protein
MSWSTRLHRAARLPALALAFSLVTLAAVAANRSFESPEAAMDAFGVGVVDSQEAVLRGLLGDDFRALIPPVGAEDRRRFLEAWAQSHKIERVDDTHAQIAVGKQGWTLPIPLVKDAAGWHFDTQAGAEEMRIRRIGRNELASVQTLLAVFDAQREYASEYRDGSKLLTYASKMTSTPGRHDGLYWPTAAGEQPSPIGPALASAAKRSTSAQGYHGYHYRLLTSQGPNAPGGAYDYLVRGKLLGGFAVIAWPARYWDSGVMTFIVSHDGEVYERDLGPDTTARAAAIKSFDPGTGWTKVK